MIQVRTQYSLNKDRQRPEWQPHKSWTLCPDFQDVQVKQLMQYPLVRRSKWKMHQRYFKFQSQNARIFGYVYQSTNGQNHGPVWMSQSFLSKGICTAIFWQDYCGKGNLRKFYWNTVGKSFILGKSIRQPSRRTVPICVCGQHQNGRQNRKYQNRLGNFWWKSLTWKNQHHSSTTYIWVALKENVQ